MNIEILREKLMPIFQRYGVTCCYLFGSRAGHDFYPDSDIDLAVIFKNFSTTRHDLAMEIEIQDAFTEILVPMEIDLMFLQKAPVYLKFNVIKNGKVIFSSDEEFRTDFEDVTVRDYLDFKPVLDLYYREMAEAILEKNGRR